jgi:hypothetical protein
MTAPAHALRGEPAAPLMVWYPSISLLATNAVPAAAVPAAAVRAAAAAAANANTAGVDATAAADAA